MRILMVLDEEFPPDVRVENEISALTAAGHGITLLCYTRSGAKAEAQYGKARVLRVTIGRMMYKMKALALSFPFYFSFWKKHIRNALKEGHFDMIHVHDLPLLKPCLQLSGEFNIKLVADFHENRPEIMKMYHHVTSFPGNLLISIKSWQKYQQKYAPRADHLILVTPEAREYYHREYHIPLEKILVVPNYADIEKLMNIKPDQAIIEKYSAKFLLSYLGNTGVRRGTKTIIEAARILKDHKDIHFVIIGESREQEHLRLLVKEYGLDNVELPGYMTFTKAASFIMASRAGLCPFLRNVHHDTTYANKMFQYMAYGKAIIASDCPSQANVIKGEHCGLVFRAGDAADLASSILELRDGGQLEKFGRNGRQAIMDKYNTDRGYQSLIRLYGQSGQ